MYILDVFAHQIDPKSSMAAEVLSNIIRFGEPNTSHLSTPETFDSSCTQKDNQQYFRGTTTLA